MLTLRFVCRRGQPVPFAIRGSRYVRDARGKRKSRTNYRTLDATPALDIRRIVLFLRGAYAIKRVVDVLADSGQGIRIGCFSSMTSDDVSLFSFRGSNYAARISASCTPASGSRVLHISSETCLPLVNVN